MSPTISIIIPVYNAAPYFEQCLHSVLSQTYSFWQAIVVDDGSTDGSAVIAQRFAEQDSRIRVLTQPMNKGQSAARNRALEEATGEIIAFIDADDYIDPDWLQTAIDNIGNNDVLQFAPRAYRYTAPWSLFIRKRWLANHPLRFPESMVYEDVVFTASLWQARPTMRIVDYRGYHYRQHTSSVTAHTHSTTPLWRSLRAMHLQPWSFGWLPLRLAAHFAKQRFWPFILLVTLWSTLCFALPDFLDNPVNGWQGRLAIAAYCVALGGAALWPLIIATLNRYMAAIFLPLYGALGAVVSYYRVAYHATITPIILDATFHTNAGTVAGVVDISLILWLAANVLIAIFFVWWLYRSVHIEHPWRWLAVALVALPIYYNFNNRLHQSINQRYPYNIPYNLYCYAHLQALRNQPRLMPEAVHISDSPDSLTIVVVIGEAIRADHLGLNGYHRSTTPQLAKRARARTLGDVYSMHTHTAASVPHMLTPADSLHPDYAYSRESFIMYLQKEGFSTAWISNQDIGETYAHFIQSADTAIFPNKEKSVFVFDRWTDADLISEVQKLNLSAKQLLVLHTIGAHWYYANHVPEDFCPYSPITTNRVVTANDQQVVVNAYDNCVAYLDLVLDSLCSILADHTAVLIYQSDHGESLGENGNYLHAAGAEETKHPAGLIWYSDAFIKRYPQQAAYIDSLPTNGLTTDYLFPLVMQLAGLKIIE